MDTPLYAFPSISSASLGTLDSAFLLTHRTLAKYTTLLDEDDTLAVDPKILRQRADSFIVGTPNSRSITAVFHASQEIDSVNPSLRLAVSVVRIITFCSMFHLPFALGLTERAVVLLSPQDMWTLAEGTLDQILIAQDKTRTRKMVRLRADPTVPIQFYPHDGLIHSRASLQ
jgi:hypothetical protein